MTMIIGTLRETSLHASLKQLYARPGDLIEAKVGNSVIDIVRGEQMIEIQTGNFSALKNKLASNLDLRPVRVVFPIATNRFILRIANDGAVISKRKSPQKGRVEMLFDELIRIPSFVIHPNFSLEVVFIEEEVIWIDDGRGSWRRGRWSITDRRLIRLIDQRIFASVTDYRMLLPPNFIDTFTSQDLARELHLRKNLTNKMIYSLKAMEIIRVVGKKGRFNLYTQQ